MAVGVYKKFNKDGKSCSIMVRFKYRGKNYGVRNYTTLYQLNTLKEGKEQLEIDKRLIREGNDPYPTKAEKILIDEIEAYEINESIELEKKNYKKTIDECFEELCLRKSKGKEKWGEHNTKQTIYFYEKVIKQRLGYIKINEIDSDMLETIETELDDANKSSSWQNRYLNIIKPIFRRACAKGEIEKDISLDLKYKKIKRKKALNLRVSDDNLILIKKIIYAIKIYVGQKEEQREQIKYFFLLCVYTAHRYGELLQLTRDDCYTENGESLIISPESITKTEGGYIFPIPPKCLEYIKSVKKGSLLFPDLKYKSLYQLFQNIINNYNEEEEMPKRVLKVPRPRIEKEMRINFRKNEKITIHDIRSLFLMIGIRSGMDSKLVDFALEHKEQGVINHYLNFEYKDKVEVYENYWRVIEE